LHPPFSFKTIRVLLPLRGMFLTALRALGLSGLTTWLRTSPPEELGLELIRVGTPSARFFNLLLHLIHHPLFFRNRLRLNN
jgi:hypothetical protein